ncbi:MAG: hypothetical protein IKJ45_10830, partial [Kiritimatiellae bacterium]|nr:hypothetical protein [Kiritimatiellia bacterium]
MNPTDDIIKKRSFDALENAATATANVIGVAKEWATCFDKGVGECPFVRLSVNLNEEGSKQFGMLRRAMKHISAVRSCADYSDSASRIIRNYQELLETIRSIHEEHPSLMVDEQMLADIQSAVAHMGAELMRIDSSPVELNTALDRLVNAFNPLSSAFKEEEDVLLGISPGRQANNG